MDLTIALALIVGAAMTIFFWVTGFIAARSADQLRSRRVAEQIRGRFAEARTRLFRLAAEGRVDPNSESFKTFYFVHTAVMRRDDQYDDLFRALVDSLGVKSEPNGTLAAERAEWSPEMRDIARLTSEASWFILTEKSMLLRGARWIAVRLSCVAPALVDEVRLLVAVAVAGGWGASA